MVETLEANLSAGMHWLQVSYSVWFNRRHSRVGHLFQGRFKGIVVDPDTWGVTLSHYIHLNPVRVARLGLGKAGRANRVRGAQGLVSSECIEAGLKVLRDYQWSSYHGFVGLAKAPNWLETGWLLSRMGGDRPATLEVGRIGRVVRRFGLSVGRGRYKEGDGTIRERSGVSKRTRVGTETTNPS